MAIRLALLSVYDKTGIVDFARALHAQGVGLLSTGGTFAALTDAGLPVTEVAEHTGFPEMMDGRVKTLHPRIHGGLLARRDDPAHLAAAATHGIPLIDLVVVNLYPFEATCDRPGATTAEKIEKIDIGGPSMLRSAAKNHGAVTVICDPADYAQCLAEMTAHAGDTTPAFRQLCARKVFQQTARYDALIADELVRMASAAGRTADRASGTVGAGATGASQAEATPATSDDDAFPAISALPLKKVQNLRYGENPHQRAALYDLRLPGASGVVRAVQKHGKELSYNNYMDADAAWELVKEFAAPACAIIKHTNPCGCAVAADLATAFRRAYDGDPQAAFGSIIAFNRELDGATAAALAEPGRFVEVVVAPSYSAEAFTTLTTVPKWKNSVRLLATGPATEVPADARYVKHVLGGLLVQDVDTRGWEPAALVIKSQRPPTADELRDLEIAWLIAKHLKSNAISLVRGGELVGAGAGQMSRVTSTFLATHLAGDRAMGASLGSDAFFPFPDGVETAAAAGVTAIVQPGGSKGDDAVIAAADRLGLAMVFTGVRHFRH
jgi:phosphoribosylaminoimidazolecarboxamide formyltransferase/IMP cyclohydrolase